MNNAKSKSRQEINEVVDAFKVKIVKHQRMADAEKAMVTLMSNTPNKRIAYLTGPTGVGKTSLLKICMRRIFRMEEDAMKADSGYIPVSLVELRNPERGVFDWTLLYRDILHSLNEPLIDKKKLIETDPRVKLLLNDLSVKSRSLTIYRDAADSAMRNRRLQTLLLDEGQHILRTASGRSLRGQLDTIKTRVSLTGVMHILSGTYDLLDGLDLSGQLSRRRELIHISRYVPTEPRDRKAFAAALDTLADDLPLKLPASFLNDLDFIFVKTLGCVGVLKDWLSDSLYIALERGDRSITHAVLKQHALSNRQLTIMLEEARQGELLLGGPSDDVLLKEMGALKTAELPPESPRSKSRRMPGTRDPVRDPIGMYAVAR